MIHFADFVIGHFSQGFAETDMDGGRNNHITEFISAVHAGNTQRIIDKLCKVYIAEAEFIVKDVNVIRNNDGSCEWPCKIWVII